MKNNDPKLKAALLSVYLITASLNAITANVPEIAKSFPAVPLYVIELIATIPSLFQMIGVICGSSIAHKIGYKRTVVSGLAACAVGGSVPLFIQNFYLLFVTRCLFGLGCGLISTAMLTMIIYFFTGDTRSAMIGLTGSIGGLGSALSSFIAGRLLAFGWQASFAVYLFGFVVMAVILIAVPNEHISASADAKEKTKNEKKGMGSLIILTLIAFLSTLFATFYVIKASTLITSEGLGTAQDGSLAITLISVGSLLAGAMYGKIYSRMKDKSLLLFYIVSALGMFCGLVHSLLLIYVGAFLIGWGLIAFTPYFQERAAHDFPQFGETATTFILVAQAVGAFAAPYLGVVLNGFTASLSMQFGIVGVLYLVLTAVAPVV